MKQEAPSFSGSSSQFTKIPSHYTSQLCSKCGTISRENRKTQELFECSGCSEKRNADYNSSINISLIGESEVLTPKMLVKDTSSWWIPKVLNKNFIKSHLEDIIAEPAFQQRRENLLRLANSSWVSSIFTMICYYSSIVCYMNIFNMK